MSSILSTLCLCVLRVLLPHASVSSAAGAISVETRAGVALRVLAGDSYCDVSVEFWIGACHGILYTVASDRRHQQDGRNRAFLFVSNVGRMPKERRWIPCVCFFLDAVKENRVWCASVNSFVALVRISPPEKTSFVRQQQPAKHVPDSKNVI